VKAVTNLRFRDAVSEDVPIIVAMYADDELGASREDPSHPLAGTYWAAFRAIDADPRHHLVVAEADGVIVATLQLSYLPYLTHQGGERAQIEAVRVSAEHRDGGVGTAVFEWAIAQARRRGCRMVQLTTNADRPDAHRFYDKLGFSASHIGMKLDLHAES
jgi:GNAT superfamily N-acetyltransferase